jgi:GT2 family glycosyltransferase
MKAKIKHAVIILNYNGSSETISCLDSINKTKDTPHVIVVDNSSTDDSVAALLARYPKLDLIKSEQNLGFAGGNNLGIKKALRLGAKVVYLLNNDTVVDPDLFFRAYRATLGKNAIIGAKIYYAKNYEYHGNQKGQGNILWYAGGEFDWSSVTATHRGVDQPDLAQFETIQKTGFVTGCFMAIPRAVVSKLGYLDDSLFLYLEDADYCLRAQKQGVNLIYHPRLILYHKNSVTSSKSTGTTDYYITRNRFSLAKKYGGFKLTLALVREALTRNWNNPLRRAAFFDYLWGKMGNRNEKITSLVLKNQN